MKRITSIDTIAELNFRLSQVAPSLPALVSTRLLCFERRREFKTGVKCMSRNDWTTYRAIEFQEMYSGMVGLNPNVSLGRARIIFDSDVEDFFVFIEAGSRCVYGGFRTRQSAQAWCKDNGYTFSRMAG